MQRISFGRHVMLAGEQELYSRWRKELKAAGDRELQSRSSSREREGYFKGRPSTWGKRGSRRQGKLRGPEEGNKEGLFDVRGRQMWIDVVVDCGLTCGWDYRRHIKWFIWLK